MCQEINIWGYLWQRFVIVRDENIAHGIYEDPTCGQDICLHLSVSLSLSTSLTHTHTPLLLVEREH